MISTTAQGKRLSQTKGRGPATRRLTPGFFIRWLLITVAGLWAAFALMLMAVKWIDPPTTAVHIERRVEAWIHHTSYRERYTFVPLNDISPQLQHAVVSAEAARV